MDTQQIDVMVADASHEVYAMHLKKSCYYPYFSQ